MNAYFFNITPEERKNILDSHKTVYDGYVTQYVKPNQEPLYVQDLANDKNGITVNNKGNVGVYKNVAINEIDSKFAPAVIGTDAVPRIDILNVSPSTGVPDAPDVREVIATDCP